MGVESGPISEELSQADTPEVACRSLNPLIGVLLPALESMKGKDITSY